MIFQSAYYAPMDRGYLGNNTKQVSPNADIEQPISPIESPIKEIGQTVTEGRQFGTFLQSAQAAIRMGTGQIELQPGMGGGEEPAGVENYGKDAREALNKSEMLRHAFGDEVIDHYVRAADWEIEDFQRVVTDYEVKRGFERS